MQRDSTTTSVVNEREFRVVGLSRSGNHAVINWIIEQAEGRVCFLNCVEPKQNPFESPRPMGDGRCFKSTYEMDLEREARGELSAKELLIYNYEDCFLGMVTDEEFEASRERWLGTSREQHDLLILRDPFNLFASRKRSGMYRDREREGANLVTLYTAVRIWKQHAAQFLGRRSYLQPPVVPVNYNRWATERAYREQLARRLDLQFTDAGVEAVPQTAGGSSFDGRAYAGEAGEMEVLTRWKHYAGDEELWRYFDEELLEMSEAIFGRLPGTRALVTSQGG